MVDVADKEVLRSGGPELYECFPRPAACTQTTMSDDKKPLVDSKSSPDAPSTPQRLPPTGDINELHARFRADPRFNPPTPSILTRLALLVLVIILFWFGVNMRKELATPPPEVQAMR